MHKFGTNLAIVYWLKCRFNDLFLFLISDIFLQDWLLICSGRDQSFISQAGAEGVTVWSARCAHWDKKCLAVSQSFRLKNLLQNLLNFSNNAGPAGGSAASLMSGRESVPVEIFDYLLHWASRAIPAPAWRLQASLSAPVFISSICKMLS